MEAPGRASREAGNRREKDEFYRKGLEKEDRMNRRGRGASRAPSLSVEDSTRRLEVKGELEIDEGEERA